MAKPIPSVALISSGTIDAGGTGIISPIYVGNYWKKTIYINTNRDTDVYIKAGPNDTDMYHIKSGYTSGGGSSDDGDYKFEPNNARECFDVDIHCAYLQIVIDNMDGSNALTCDLWISGVGQ